MAMSPQACVSCGAELVGSYCHACGERDPIEREHSIRGFLRDHAAAFVDAHGKGPRSFGMLIAKPGLLTAEYMRGRTVRYLHPLQLFLFANILFFITLSFTGVRGLSTPLRQQLEMQAYSEVARDALRSRFLEMETVQYEAFEARFDLASEVQSKSLVIVLIPMFTLLLWLTRAWRREPGVQHIVFSTHFMSFALLLFMLIGTLLRASALLPASVQPFVTTDTAATLTAVTGGASYVYLALRRAYGDSRLAALARSVVLGFGYIILLVTYRFILFFTVLYSL